ncbi:MAG TPA: citrate transporter [Candidatus Eisenbergiella merdipullorum]|uniref:Citrate transporter n=1 Tax=Candidatus Eisenbergiella merdipullorum TaxID=2838553 RepID=A0A9D2I2Z3_9FIRM|nr:citrate transporter [Candidatus Eisenbergiella merdipullorum]
MTAAQILAVIIFAAMFLLIVSEKIERHVVSLGCGLLMMVLVFGVCMRSPAAIWDTLNLRNFFSLDFWYQAGEAGESSSGINWSTILFIAGMMLMVEGMGKAGFFRWLCLQLAKMVKYRVVPLFVVFMVMSSVLAMFIDSITVILFLAAATVELARLLKFNPVPMIISEIFCANLGGSATMCGDPPNIIIGTSLGFSFADFITNTGVIAAFSLILVIFYFYFCFRKELEMGEKSEAALKGRVSYPDPRDAIENRKDFAISSAIFAAAVILLVTHAQTGLTVAAIGVFIGLVTLVTAGKDALGLLKKVDYKTLLFFIGLFIVVGGLEQTGILEVIAAFIANVSGDNAMLMVAIVLWISALASAFVDNIPFAATMIPVIRSLAEAQSVDLSVLAWALSIGTDIGGSGTPIGASANVVGISVASKEGHVIGWGKYCRYAAPATVLVVLFSMIAIYVRYF